MDRGTRAVDNNNSSLSRCKIGVEKLSVRKTDFVLQIYKFTFSF